MKRELAEFIDSKFQEIIAEKSQNTHEFIFKLSFLLLAAAALKLDTYHRILGEIVTAINSPALLPDINKPWQLWIMGRMAMAAHLAGDHRNLLVLIERLNSQIVVANKNDLRVGLACAHLAAINGVCFDQTRRVNISLNNYTQYHQKLSEYIVLAQHNFKKNPQDEFTRDTYIWMLVLKVYAAANHSQKDYVFALEELRSISDKKTVRDTIQLVSKKHMGGFLASLLRYSFVKMADDERLKELPAVKVSDVGILDFDELLTRATELLTTEKLSTPPSIAQQFFYRPVSNVVHSPHSRNAAPQHK